MRWAGSCHGAGRAPPALPSPALSHDRVTPLVAPPPAPCREKEGNSLEVPAALALARQLLPWHAGARTAAGTCVYLQARVCTQKHRDAFMLLTHTYVYTHICACMHTCIHVHVHTCSPFQTGHERLVRAAGLSDPVLCASCCGEAQAAPAPAKNGDSHRSGTLRSTQRCSDPAG